MQTAILKGFWWPLFWQSRNRRVAFTIFAFYWNLQHKTSYKNCYLIEKSLSKTISIENFHCTNKKINQSSIYPHTLQTHIRESCYTILGFLLIFAKDANNSGGHCMSIMYSYLHANPEACTYIQTVRAFKGDVYLYLHCFPLKGTVTVITVIWADQDSIA